MYGAAGERRLTEYEVDWLPGYEGSSPVRVGNAASEQFQLDVYGEVFDALHLTWRVGHPAGPVDLAAGAHAARLPRGRLARAGRGDLGGARRAQHFTHSKVMAWVAFDRAVKSVTEMSLVDVDTDALGVRCATRSTRRSAPRASTRSGTRSCSTTARRRSTRACS